MTAIELRDWLNEAIEAGGGERIIVLASDQEGNSHRALRDMGTCAFDAKHEEIGMEELTDADRERGYSEDDVMEGGVPAICLS